MPGGSKPGERRGGRKKGTPNKATTESRALWQAVFEDLAPQAATWIKAAAVEDPGKAAELTIRIAEYFVPKMATKLEMGGPDGGPLKVSININRAVRPKETT